MLRKVFTLVLSMLVFGQQFMYAANGFFDKDDFLSNVNPASSFTDFSNGTQFYHGGSVVFKFSDTGKGVAPLINWAEPSINAGCNGISISGGFLSVLGLDGLAEQLQDAGTALLWGVLTGLIYSMPGIGEVFKQIRAWAQWLQQFLQKSCEIGRAIGDRMAEETGFKSGAEDVQNFFASSLANAENEVLELLGNPGKYSVNEVIDMIKKQPKCEGGDGSGNCQNDNSKSGQEQYFDMMENRGFAKLIYAKDLTNGAEQDINSRIVIGGTSKDDLYVMLVNFFGDISISDHTAEFIERYKDEISHYLKNGEMPDTPKGNEIVDMQATEMAKAIKGGSGRIIPPKTNECIKSTVTAEEIKNYFINGTTSSTSNSTTATLDLRAPELYQGKVTCFDGATFMTNFTLRLTDTAAAVNWGGFEQESRDRIECYINNVLDGTSNDCTTVGIPISAPRASRFLTITKEVAILEKKSNAGLGFETSGLIDVIAQYNAYFYAQYLLDLLKKQVATYNKDSDGKSLSEPEDRDCIGMDTMAKEIQAALIDTINENVQTPLMVQEVFDEVETNLKKARSRGMK